MTRAARQASAVGAAMAAVAGMQHAHSFTEYKGTAAMAAPTGADPCG